MVDGDVHDTADMAGTVLVVAGVGLAWFWPRGVAQGMGAGTAGEQEGLVAGGGGSSVGVPGAV